MEKLPHYYFSWIDSFQKQRHICETLPLETKQSGGKLLHLSDLSGGVFIGEISSSRRYSIKNYKEKKKTATLQALNVERKNLESRREIGKFEKGNAEE